MSAIKRELERIAEMVIYGNYEQITAEFIELEKLGATAETFANIVDTAKAIAPKCDCGANYFEGVKD